MVTTTATSAMITCVMRLYQPDTRAIVSSNHASMLKRNESRSPRASSSSPSSRPLTAAGRPSPTIASRVSRMTSWSAFGVPSSAVSATSGAIVSMRASANERGAM